ncbi:MAG: Fic family protein [Phycisphaeraceae bacterium]|nr:MAG: Fic family protein [Phycisphaeraceae bacterium]
MRIPKKPPDIWDIGVEGLLAKAAGPEYQALARLCEERYLHWDKLVFIARGQGLEPEPAWAMVKMGRMVRYRELPLRGADRPLRFLSTDGMQRSLMLIDRELAGQIGVGDEQPFSRSDRERFIVRALREEAIASSMLEGAATTRVEARRMLKKGRKPRTRGERMVLNNYRAIQFIREHGSTNLSDEFLLELQGMLTVDTLDDPEQVGRFRTSDDEVAVVDQRDGEVVHTPPDAAELRERLDALYTFANEDDNDATEFIHPVIKACILHFQIGFDHPFCDGNGRTARALFYWFMLRSGYWLFEYLPISRLIYDAPGKYVRAYLYSETDDYDITYFLRYHIAVISRARKQLSAYIARKHAEMRTARTVFSSDAALNHRQRETLLEISRNPDRFFTIDEHRDKHGVIYETARTDLLKLAERGYLVKSREGRKFVFAAGPKLADAMS